MLTYRKEEAGSSLVAGALELDNETCRKFYTFLSSSLSSMMISLYKHEHRRPKNQALSCVLWTMAELRSTSISNQR